MLKIKLLILSIITLVYSRVYASEHLHINILKADSMFLKTNYLLLAASMNIDVLNAQIIQAKLYPNPNLSFDINAYDPQNKEFLHIGKTGQKVFQFEQLVLLGGKRKAQIDIAKTNSSIAVLEFQDMVRQLKFALHSSMFNLNQQSLLIQKYDLQLQLLDSILASYKTQVEKGNIPLKDLVRLKGVYLNLSNNRADIYQKYYEELSIIQTILQTNLTIIPDISDKEFESFIRPVDKGELQIMALQNRPDYLISESNALIAQQYYAYQKSLAVPDINIFTSYDQRGGAFNNQINIGISFPLMTWNRNQGNILSSKYMINQNYFKLEALKVQINTEVEICHSIFEQSISEYNKIKSYYNEDFEITLEGISENFKNGNVSMLEFIDFFEGYNNALAEIARIKVQLATTGEKLNFVTGKQIF